VSRSKAPVIVLGWEFSRQGGVQEVSRQVAEMLSDSTAFDARAVRYPRIEKVAAVLRSWLARTAGRGTACVFMHPHIFQECVGLFSAADAPATVVWAHGIDVWGEFGRRFASALPLATKVAASSGYTADRIRENFPGADVSVIRLAVEDPPAAAARGERGGFEIVTVSRLAGDDGVKGHDLVLRALGLLATRGLRIPYHVVGTGPDQPRLERLAHELGLAEQVVFHGYLPDDEKERIYARAGAFVMPSRVVRREHGPWSGEGFGLVYLEAALRGLPVIACDEGGQVECVVDGTTGFLVRPEPEVIADRIARLAAHPEERRRLGEAGREFVRQRFTPAQFRADLETIISAAIASRAGRENPP
jgi:phosphatidylinositol alpha-1,6-mannosyltransferase